MSKNYFIDLLNIGCPEKIKEIQDANDAFHESRVNGLKQKAELYEYIYEEKKKQNLE